MTASDTSLIFVLCGVSVMFGFIVGLILGCRIGDQEAEKAYSESDEHRELAIHLRQAAAAAVIRLKEAACEALATAEALSAAAEVDVAEDEPEASA